MLAVSSEWGGLWFNFENQKNKANRPQRGVTNFWSWDHLETQLLGLEHDLTCNKQINSVAREGACTGIIQHPKNSTNFLIPKFLLFIKEIYRSITYFMLPVWNWEHGKIKGFVYWQNFLRTWNLGSNAKMVRQSKKMFSNRLHCVSRSERVLKKKIPTFHTQPNDSSFLGRDECKTLGQRINFRNINHHTLPATAVHNGSNLVTAHHNKFK